MTRADLANELLGWLLFAWELGLMAAVVWIWLCVLGPARADRLATRVFFGDRRSTSRQSIYPSSASSASEVRRG